MTSTDSQCLTSSSTFLASSRFVELFCHVGSLLNVLLSTYSLFLIAVKSPPAMRSSIPYLLNLAIWTAFCDFTWAVLLVPTFFFPIIAAHGSGVLVRIGVPKPAMFWLGFASLGGVTAAIITLFEQRHTVIVTNSRFVMRRKSTRHVFYVLLYAHLLNFGLPELLTSPDDQREAKRLAHEEVPCLPADVFWSDETLVLQSDRRLFSPHMWTVALGFACLMYFYCTHILFHLSPRQNPAMSTRTRRLFRSLFLAQCVQVAVPTLVIGAPNIYWNVSVTTRFYSQELNNLSTVNFTLHGVSASIATVLFYTPYRRFTLQLVLPKRLLKMEKQKSKKMSTVAISVCA